MMRATVLILPIVVCSCGSPTESSKPPAYAPADAYDRLKVGMTVAEANRALGSEGWEITASGAQRTLAWPRRGRSNVTANFVRNRLTAKRE